MSTVEKIEAVNRYILKAKRIVTVLILIAAAWVTFDVYRKRNKVPPLDIRPTLTLGATDVAFNHPSGWDVVPLGTADWRLSRFNVASRGAAKRCRRNHPTRLPRRCKVR